MLTPLADLADIKAPPFLQSPSFKSCSENIAYGERAEFVRDRTLLLRKQVFDIFFTIRHFRVQYDLLKLQACKNFYASYPLYDLRRLPLADALLMIGELVSIILNTTVERA